MEKMFVVDGRMIMHDCITLYIYILCNVKFVCLSTLRGYVSKFVSCATTLCDESYQAQKSESEVRCRWNGASIPIFGRDQLCVYMLLLKYE